MPAQRVLVTGCSSPVAGCYEHLMLNGPGLGQHVPVLLPEPGPGGREKEDFYILGDGAEESAEAQVIADGDTALMTVQAEGGDVSAALKDLVFPAGGEKMHLVIGGDFLPCPVKDIAGIVDFSRGRVQPGHRAAYYVDCVLLGKSREQGAGAFSVLIGVILDGAGEEAYIPHFRQQEYIWIFLHGIFCHMQKGFLIFF